MKRYYLIDALRGLDVISMVLFHFCFDYFMVYGHDTQWYYRTSTYIWQQSICWIFILISGFVWKFGEKGALKRGLFLEGCAVLITVITVLFMPSEAIWFGVLFLIGTSVLIMIPLEKLLCRVDPFIGCAVSFVLFIFLKNIQRGYVGFDLPFVGDILHIDLPRVLYDIRWLTPFGFPYPGFVSGDYFPLLPWIFLYFTGYFLYRIFLRSERAQKIAETKLPVLSIIGKYSIWIYLVHQPVCMLVCEILSLLE